MQIEKYNTILNKCHSQAKCIIVSKHRSVGEIHAYYKLGHRDFGENKVQELMIKKESLPQDIAWHMIGHLQSNKVKYIATFIACIHSIDSIPLLKEVDCQANKHNRIISVLLQFNIAQEETKFGFPTEDWKNIMEQTQQYSHVDVQGIMVMGPHCDNAKDINKVFQKGKQLLNDIQHLYPNCQQLSMGMSDDYLYALHNGATMIRIGSILF